MLYSNNISRFRDFWTELYHLASAHGDIYKLPSCEIEYICRFYSLVYTITRNFVSYHTEISKRWFANCCYCICARRLQTDNAQSSSVENWDWMTAGLLVSNWSLIHHPREGNNVGRSLNTMVQLDIEKYMSVHHIYTLVDYSTSRWHAKLTYTVTARSHELLTSRILSESTNF